MLTVNMEEVEKTVMLATALFEHTSKETIDVQERGKIEKIKRHLSLDEDILTGDFKAEIDDLYAGFPLLPSQYRILDKVGEGF